MASSAMAVVGRRACCVRGTLNALADSPAWIESLPDFFFFGMMTHLGDVLDVLVDDDNIFCKGDSLLGVLWAHVWTFE